MPDSPLSTTRSLSHTRLADRVHRLLSRPGTGWRPRAWLASLCVPVLVLTLAPAATTAAAAPTGGGVLAQGVVDDELAAQLEERDRVTFWAVLDEQADLGIAATADWRGRGFQVHQRLATTAERSQADLRHLLADHGAEWEAFWIVNTIRITGDRELVERVAARPEVAEVVADRTFDLPDPGLTEQDAVAAIEWNVERVGAPEVWSEYDARGEQIVVASIDTGVQFDHPALVAQYRGTREDGTFDHNYNWFDPSQVCGSPSLAPCDNNGHGTHVTGTMVGDDGDPGDNRIGVAPKARWIAAKGCESTTCSLSALLASGQWMLAPTDLNGDNPDPSMRPHIVNNSWGNDAGADTFYQATVQAWVAAGIFPVFSNGNAGPGCGTVGSPASYPDSYGVGAFASNDAIAGFSSRGPAPDAVGGHVKPDISAPGVNVRSSLPGGGYGGGSGTSMAAPHVSATVALMWSAAPALIGNIDLTREFLDDTAEDVEDLTCGGSPDHNNVWGHGRLDAYAAVTQSPRGPTGTLQGAVTDSDGSPVAGASVTVSGPADRSAVTDTAGNYQLLLPVGTYDVTVEAYGYEPVHVNGLVVVEDETTVEDVVLVPLPAVTVTGTVDDGSGQDWPLYARIDIAGYPGGPVFTDPVTGQFEVELVQDTTFGFEVHALGGGYQVAEREVTYAGPVATEDFTVTVDTDACRAPGYRVEGGLCVAVPGGMLLGNVYDLATGEAIDGAAVTSDEAPDDTATSGPTPQDANLDDGFYLLFSSLTGPRPFTVSRDGFGSTTVTVDVAGGAVRRHDFELGSGLLTVHPGTLSASPQLGATVERTLTITNEGTADASFELGERDRGSDILAPAGAGQDAPPARISGTFSPLSSALAPPSATQRGATADPAWTVTSEGPWVDIAPYPVIVMDNLADSWEGSVYSVSGISAADGTRIHEMYRYDPDDDSWTERSGTVTGRERPNGAIIDGRFYVVGGWNVIGTPVTSLEIYDIATDTWSTGASIPTAYAASSNVVLDDKLYLIGGCQAGCGFTDVWVYDPPADEWSQAAPYPEPISWAHCGAIDGRIYCAGGAGPFNTSTANGYVYDPAADQWSSIAPLPQDQWGGGYVTANGQLLVSGGVTDNFATITNEGFSYDPQTDAWSPLPNSNNVLYRGASACGLYRVGGSVSGFTPVADSEVLPGFDGCGVTDLPWLDVSPASGTVPAGGSVQVTVTFDASVAEVDQPGAYRAALAVDTDTPHAVPAVPVTMDVRPPPSWGKVQGTVVGLDRCDMPGAPLVPAHVHISGRTTDVTVTTAPDGTYEWWLSANQNPLTLSVQVDGWVGQERQVVVPARRQVIEDFTLRLDAPCAQPAPESLEFVLEQGAGATAPLELGNQPAAGELTFRIDQTPLALDPLVIDSTGVAAAGVVAAGKSSPAATTNPPGSGVTDVDGWLRGEDLPFGYVRYAHAQCDGDHDSIYVLSGAPQEVDALDQMWRYSASADAWTRLAPLPSGTAREGPTAVCEAGRLHVLGGGGGNLHLVYDIARDSWSTAAAVPRGVWGAAGGAYNGKVFLMGGDAGAVGGAGASTDGVVHIDDPTVSATNTVNIYDVATNTWIGTGAPMPAPVITPGYTQAGRYVYVVGSWAAQTPGPNNLTQRYDMVTDTWQVGPTFEPGRADFALAATDDALYAIGGSTGFTTPNSDVERLDLASWPDGAWEAIEPLPIEVWGNNGGFCTTTGPFDGEVWSVSGTSPGLGWHGRTYYRDSGGAGCPTIRADVPWLDIDVGDATVPADGSLTVDVTVDSAGLAPGIHRATLLITTNDPARPEIRLPVHVTVGEVASQ